MTHDTNARPKSELVVLDRQVINEMVGKIADVAEQPHTQAELAGWETKHGSYHLDDARPYAVVGETLMYLHTCQDGIVVPVALYPDGSTKIYTDQEHVGELSRRT